MQSTVAYLRSSGSKYDTFWLDVEGRWGPSKSANQQFFEGLVSQALLLNQTVGVVTSKAQWTSIMGDSYTKGSPFPLWYTQGNNIASFDDFVPFGGWTQPVMKQWTRTDAVCGVEVGFNWAKSINY